MATLEGLAARVQELTEGLQRANVAYEQQQKRAAEAEARLLAAEAVIQSQQAAAAAAATTATSSTERREKELIHPSHVPKPHTFNGKKDEWEKFKHVFIAWSSTVHERYPELLEKHGKSKDPVDESTFTSEESRLAKAMYTFLIQYCPEPTMNVIGQGLRDANGFEVWRRLVLLSEPAHRTKAWVWRRHLANPTFPSEISQWSTALHQWEAELREFERTYKTAFSEDEKVSILAHVAPKELQQSIFMHSDALDSYNKIREYIEQYLINRNLWKRPQGSQFGLTKAANKNAENPTDDGGPRPMDIGALKGDRGKGKGDRTRDGKGKDDWKDKEKEKWNGKGSWNGKGNWDNKDSKGKGKKGKEGKGKGGNDKGKGKGKQGEGKGKGNNPHAGKQCHICHRHGHIAADCWWKVGAVDAEAATDTGGTGGSGNTKDNTSSSSTAVGSVFEGTQRIARWSDEDVIFTVGDSIVSAVGPEQLGCRHLLVDSGACESVAKFGDFSAEIDSSKAKPLFSVQGTPLKVYGKQYPQVMFGQTSGSVEMTVTDAAESLVSVHSLVAKGHKVVFSPGGCYLETRAGDTVPLELHGKRWYLKVMDKTESSTPVRGRIAPIGDEPDFGPREPDRWKREVKDGDEYLIREHNNPRKRLFAPRVKDLPVPLERIESGRLTKMIFEDDGSRREDRSMWEDKRYAMREFKHAWLGETWFRLKPERAEEGAAAEEQPSHEDEWMQGLDEAYEEEAAGGEEAHERIVEDDEDAEERLMIDDESGEKKAKAIKAPKEPTAAEVEEHNLHHANFESWCPVCVMGQGKSKQHRRVKEDPKEHIIYSDYMFFTKEGTEVSKEDSEKKKAGLVTVLTAICKESQYPFALVLPSKASVDYASKAMMSWIKDLKWDKVVIQFDQESALNKIYEKVKAGMGDTVTLRRSPRYSSQSLADGEMVNGLIAGKVRTWLAEVSEKYKMKIGCDSVLFPWIVRHSAWTLARFHINHSKTTAFRIVNGYDYLGEMMVFGQVAMAKYPKQRDKSAPRWIRGVYVGKNAVGDEHLLLTEAGVQTCRTVRRLPESSQYSSEVLEKARGVPWNRYLGIATSRVQQEKSENKAVAVPELEAAETYDFGSSGEKEVVFVPTPAAPALEKRGERATASEPESKRARVEPAEAQQPAGDTAGPSGGPARFNIATPDASMGTGSQDLNDSLYSPSIPGDMAQDMVSCISNDGEWNGASTCLGKEDYEYYKKWLKQNEGLFNSNMVSNIMDYLDTMQMDERELKRARKEELRKLNEVYYGAFTPRDRRQLSKDLSVFGHKWVDKVTEGVAKSRLTCQDFKKKQEANEKHSSEYPSNFCPTPHATSRKLLEVYSLATQMPRVKADLSSAFLIARDGGDARGQPVLMRPPKEWLEEYDEWFAKARPEIQEQMRGVPKEEILWQVDGNLYGRQSAAAQYRDRLEEILTKELPKEKYFFKRGKLDACVFRCTCTGIVLVHHIDDFDVCGPADLLQDLLQVQLPKCGCKLKMGELEWPGEASTSTSEFLGRKKILVENAVVTLPNEKHATDILRMLGLENAKPSPVPGKKLNLSDNKPLDGKAKEIFASCVGSATYLSQDRPDIKFACKELAKRIRDPRECDMQNLKVLGRYLRGTMQVGHVTKLNEQVDSVAGIPLQGFCDSDWAGDKEDRKSTSGQVIVLGGTVVETSARTQQGTPATSSGEAEVRALTQCAQDLVFVRNLGVEDFGMSIDVPRLFCDSSAAIQVARRLGVGKMRHIDLGHLYIQELVREKRVIVQKIKGTENPSNALTKHLATGAEAEEAREMLGLVTLDKQGLDKHVSKNTMQSVGALASWKKWQPQQCTRLSTKQLVSAVAKHRPLRETPNGSYPLWSG